MDEKTEESNENTRTESVGDNILSGLGNESMFMKPV